jgi:hypothetical protein
MEMTYKVSDLKKLVAESSNEFKAVLGPGVESENKKNNGKAYSDAKKRAKDYDGGLEKEVGEEKPKYEKLDANKTTIDYKIDNASKEYKDRVKAQVKGYTSAQEMNNGIEKAGDYSDNENIYNGIKDSGKKIHDAEREYKFTKVQTREKPREYERNEMYESKDGFDMRNMIDTFRSNTTPTVLKEHVKTVYFKKTTFLSEDHMKSRIPDEFKKEGEQFKMKDKTGNTYLMEWKNNEGKIIGHSNKTGMVESLDRMKEMYGYSTQDTNTTKSYRINEGESALADTLAKMRKIID